MLNLNLYFILTLREMPYSALCIKLLSYFSVNNLWLGLGWITGARLVDSVGYASFSTQHLWLHRHRQNHVTFYLSAPSNLILLFSISSCSWSRRTQALCSGFWSWSVWWTGSWGVQSQKLILQLVVFWCMWGWCCNNFGLVLYTRKP